MTGFEKYGIAVGQVYVPANGSSGTVTVTDVETYADCGDVVVFYATENRSFRIDCFKLAMVRYCLLTNDAVENEGV